MAFAIKIRKRLKLTKHNLIEFSKGLFIAMQNPNYKRVCFVNWWPNQLETVLFYRWLKLIDKEVLISFYKPDLVFYSVFGNKEIVNRSFRRSKKIFYTGENVRRSNFSSYSNHMLDEVDLSIGFEKIMHQNYIRLPLWVLYFMSDLSLSNEDIKFKITKLINQKALDHIFAL